MALAPRRSKTVLLRRGFVLLLNVTSTTLMLLTGLFDNPIIVALTGRYKFIRSRLQDGSINYAMARMEAVNSKAFHDLADVGTSYSFFSTPDRSPETMGEDRSLCMRVNSMNATTIGIFYDDYAGYGPRRTVHFSFSISAPNCQVINFRPAWYQTCIKDVFKSNQTMCHQYILDNFDNLQQNKQITMQSDSEFGEVGQPILKCLRRPNRPFEFNMDYIGQHSYWAGNVFHFEIQTCICQAKSLLRTSDWEWTLFRIEQVDQKAKMTVAVPESGLIGQIVTPLYGIIAISLFSMGIYTAIVRSRSVEYLPEQVRYKTSRRFLRYILPFMPIAIATTEQARAVITFKGSILTASNLWLNHWLYISINILNAVVHVRMAYAKMNLGTRMLDKKITIEVFLFLCSAFTTVSWLICAAHTVIRFAFKLIVRLVIVLRLLPRWCRDQIDWYIDGTAMFSSFRLYNIYLCCYFLILLKMRGKTTLMTRQMPDKKPMFGGTPNIASFWGSELVADFAAIIPILIACSTLHGLLLLQTRYRYIVNNSVMRELQRRYFFVGWDVFTAIQVLDMDPHDPALVNGDVALAQCSLGSLLQLLYQSGPSAFVHLASDHLFVGNGFSKEAVEFFYPIKTAKRMGVYNRHMTGCSARIAAEDVNADSSDERNDGTAKAIISVEAREKENGPSGRRVVENRFKLVAEGYLSKVFLLNDTHPGVITENEDTGMREFVIRDGLSFMGTQDVKSLLGKDTKFFLH